VRSPERGNGTVAATRRDGNLVLDESAKRETEVKLMESVGAALGIPEAGRRAFAEGRPRY
jgi:hypothetical protein